MEKADSQALEHLKHARDEHFNSAGRYDTKSIDTSDTIQFMVSIDTFHKVD